MNRHSSAGWWFVAIFAVFSSPAESAAVPDAEFYQHIEFDGGISGSLGSLSDRLDIPFSRHMRKILFTLFLAGAALLGGTPVRAVSLAVVPDNDVIPIGGAFSAGLVISGLEEFSAPSLSAYDLEVTFNPLVIDLMGVSFGDPILGDQLDLFGLGSITNTLCRPC